MIQYYSTPRQEVYIFSLIACWLFSQSSPEIDAAVLRTDWSWNCRMHLAFLRPCFLFTVLFSYVVLTSLWVGGGIFRFISVWTCVLASKCHPWELFPILDNNHVNPPWKTSRRNLSVRHMLVWNVCLWNMLGYSYEETHNIRSRPCGVLCHWWWRMWHIEDKQAFPQTKIWGKPTFVFSTCLWNNHTVIVFLSIWITVVWEDFLALSIIVHFSVKGIPGHCQTLLRE